VLENGPAGRIPSKKGEEAALWLNSGKPQAKMDVAGYDVSLAPPPVAKIPPKPAPGRTRGGGRK